MFYRQKVMLALIELCGRKVASTDLQKLLFLFCQSTRQNHYDFIPYKFGAFSFVSYDDKRKLIEKRILKDVEDFELNNTSSHLAQLKTKDRLALRDFVVKTSTCRGHALVRKTYLEFPQYAVNSEIATKVLSSEEYSQVSRHWVSDAKPMLFTIGYEGITIDEYISRLIFNNIQALIDVRKNPLSRKHGFSKTRLNRYTKNVNIQYIHLPQLGIETRLRKELNGEQSYQILFDHYAAQILPKEQQAISELKSILNNYKRVALTCFEADHHLCHRHKITDLLETDETFEISIKHI